MLKIKNNTELINKIKELCKQEVFIKDILDITGISKPTFYQIIKENNIKVNKAKRKRNIDKKDEIIKMHNKGITITEICKTLNISRSSVTARLKEENIETNKIYRKTSINEDAFKIIDSEEKAYWLGFLYADGYVNNDGLHVGLKKDDKGHLEKLKIFMDSNVNIRDKSIKNNGKNYFSSTISFCSAKLSKDLINKGCLKNKSLILKFPTEDQVPNDLISHFMRGYFDGDGCITTSKPTRGTKLQRIISVIGTQDFLDKYKSILIKECELINKNKYSSCGQAYTFRLGGNLIVQKFYDFLYKDATIYLDRKYAKFNCRLEPKIQKTQDD